MAEAGDTIVPIKRRGDVLKSSFLGWQCRLRQLAVRDAGARPSAGMRPRLSVAGQDLGRIVVVITPAAPDDSTAEFKHIIRRTHDPRERYEAALRYLQAAHFQHPETFGDGLTAIFALHDPLADKLSGREDCDLAFEQFNQRYWLTCRAEMLAPDHPAYQATYWHNALFNPSLPAEVRVVCFLPDWSRARAEPPPV